jgi:hypothetical protein
MDTQLIGGLVMSCLALLLAVGLITGAIQRRRRRAENAPTYQAIGGPIYTFFQFGCAGLAIIAAVFIIVFVLLSRHH